MKTFTLESIKSIDPSFDPTQYDRIPAPGTKITLDYQGATWVIDHPQREASARELIRQHLEAKHQRKVISHDEWINLRGLDSIPVFNSVMDGTTIVL